MQIALLSLILDESNCPHYQWYSYGNNIACDAWVITDAPDQSIKKERMPPAAREALHYHSKSTQVFYILNGNATFYVENNRYELKPGQSLKIEPHQKHFIANEMNVETESYLEFLVISNPSTEDDRFQVEE